jgi:hypothetical protein
MKLLLNHWSNSMTGNFINSGSLGGAFRTSTCNPGCAKIFRYFRGKWRQNLYVFCCKANWGVKKTSKEHYQVKRYS